MRPFGEISDPRSNRAKRRFMSILVPGLCGAIAGANGPTDVKDFGNSCHKVLETLPPFPEGIPSPDELEAAFAGWMREATEPPDETHPRQALLSGRLRSRNAIAQTSAITSPAGPNASCDTHRASMPSLAILKS